MSPEQVDACMAAKNRPMFCLNAMSANLREARKTFEQLRGLILSTCRPSRLSGMLNGA